MNKSYGHEPTIAPLHTPLLFYVKHSMQELFKSSQTTKTSKNYSILGLKFDQTNFELSTMKNKLLWKANAKQMYSIGIHDDV